MEPVLVASMPGDPVENAGAKKIHPFFGGKPSTPSAETSAPSEPTTAAASANSTADEAAEPLRQDDRRKRRKTTTDVEEEPQRKKRGRKKITSLGPNITDHFKGVDASDEPIPAPAFRENANPPSIPRTTAVVNTDQPKRLMAPALQPKKMLILNSKTGTIGPPPQKPSKMVVIRYGTDHEARQRVGARIQDVLDGKVEMECRQPVRRKRGRPKRSEVANNSTSLVTPAPTAAAPSHPISGSTSNSASDSTATPAKDPHPFFTGVLRKKTVVAEDAPAPAPTQPTPQVVSHRISMSTPCPSLAKQQHATSWTNMPQFGVKSQGLHVAGFVEPAWPPLGMVHVRDEEPVRYEGVGLSNLRSRRSKRRAINIQAEESVLGCVCRRLERSMQKPPPIADDEYPPLDPALRLPKKHFESGKQVRNRVRPELRTYRPADHDELEGSGPGSHPAVSRLYDLLQTNLSAFDRSDCENATWAHKYAPKAACEVLQSARECSMLRDWLHMLKVQSVDTGAADSAGRKGRGAKAPAKKKRKKSKLDGFVVSSDEEADELDELPEEEGEWTAGGGSEMKTVVRNGDISGRDGRRLANAVVISGPHGCGKTAAVYAVAKELDFEIFEINSGSRRSGRDLMERVGDMTKNHLVQHHQSETKPDEGGDTETEDEVARDLKSGKQGVVTSFFKAKPAKPVSKVEGVKGSKAKRNEPTPLEADSKKAGAAPKKKKQSLILVEEADVLFEEDRQFWATLLTMIASSKRPFVITCSDERLIPLQTLNLHGIFRFSQVPVDLGVDVLLLVAANEGHALRRPPVETLYESRGRDMRASLTELNYWCQIGIGDQRGGFDWLYSRWPRGSDLDKHGDVVRVISDGTYAEGMGWFGRDASFGSMEPCEAEERLAGEAWDEWRLDLPVYEATKRLQGWADKCSTATAGERLASLDRLGEFYDAISEADLCSSGSFGVQFQESMDPTHPEMPIKMRDDFMVGQQLLDAPILQHQRPFGRELASSIKSLAVRVLFPQPTSCSPDYRANGTLWSWLKSSRAEPAALTRKDVSLAFDAIAVSTSSSSVSATPGTSLEPSVFDHTLVAIVLDVAPWVRGIVAFDQRLMLQRRQRSGLLGESGGSRPAKRMRNTRAALSAMEGGSRTTTRRENYFSAAINAHLVARTAAAGWYMAAREAEGEEEDVRTERRRRRSVEHEEEDTSSGSSDSG